LNVNAEEPLVNEATVEVDFAVACNELFKDHIHAILYQSMRSNDGERSASMLRAAKHSAFRR